MRVFKRGKSWYLDINFEGNRVRSKIKGARTKTEAQAALVTVKADILRGEFNLKKVKQILFKDFAEKYLRYSKKHKTSWRSDQTSLNKLKAFFGNRRLSKISPGLIDDYKLKRVDEVKPASVNRELACLKFMFSLAKKWEYADMNPVKEVRLFKERKIDMHILDKEEINRLIEVSNTYLKPIIIIALNTGMRKGEILNLGWKDIDFDEHFIFINETKSGVTRKIPMNSFVVKTLRGIKRESEFVFYNPDTKNRIKNVRSSFKTACRRIGVPDLRFHDLRHTAATYMVTGGVDLVTVSEILGHSDIKMTVRYTHPTPENRRKAVGVLAAIFDKKDENQDESDPNMAQFGERRPLIS